MHYNNQSIDFDVLWNPFFANFLCYLCLQSLSSMFSVHGSWSSWSSWPNCNKPCNGGNKTRERLCDNPEPAFGGQSCKGPKTETKPCNLDSCPGIHLFVEVEYDFI